MLDKASRIFVCAKILKSIETMAKCHHFELLSDYPCSTDLKPATFFCYPNLIKLMVAGKK